MQGWQAIIIGSYIVSIPVSIWAIGFMPGRGTLGPGWEKQRRNAAFIGFLPCGLLSLLIQAIVLLPYYGRVKSLENRGKRLTQGWNSSTGRTGNANPFGGSSGGAAPQAPGGNPFNSGEGGGTPPRNNPFA